MKAVIRIQKSRRPQSGEIKGLRLQACVPNLQGRKSKANFNALGEVNNFYVTSEEIPSFKKPYLILETGDLYEVDKFYFQRFVQNLKWEGYTELEFFGEEWEDVGFDLSPWGGPVTEAALIAMQPSIQAARIAG